jgi:hypothetical protein
MMTEKNESENIDSLYDFLKPLPREKEIAVPQFGDRKLKISRITKTEYDGVIYSHINGVTKKFESSFMPGVVVNHLVSPNLRNAEFLQRNKFETAEEALNACFQIDSIERIYGEILKFSGVQETMTKDVSVVKNC